MRKIVLLVLLIGSLALIGVGVVQLAQARMAASRGPSVVIATAVPTGDVRRMSVQELDQALKGPNPPLVWELRTAETYAQQHLPGSQLVQLAEVATAAKGLDKQRAIVTVCA